MQCERNHTIRAHTFTDSTAGTDTGTNTDAKKDMDIDMDVNTDSKTHSERCTQQKYIPSRRSKLPEQAR